MTEQLEEDFLKRGGRAIQWAFCWMNTSASWVEHKQTTCQSRLRYPRLLQCASLFILFRPSAGDDRFGRDQKKYNSTCSNLVIVRKTYKCVQINFTINNNNKYVVEENHVLCPGDCPAFAQ